MSLRAPSDKITVAPGVLLTVIRLATLQMQGIVRMGNTPGGVNRWPRRAPSETGVQIFIDEKVEEQSPNVTIDLYVVADANADLHEVSRAVQKQVAREIQDNIGMTVSAVNVYIEDVEFSES